MARSKMQKMVHQPPLYTAFKPMGVMRSELQSLPLTLDEYEAIRLADYMGMDHAEASDQLLHALLSRPVKKQHNFWSKAKNCSLKGAMCIFGVI